jgi:hypothetical protein
MPRSEAKSSRDLRTNPDFGARKKMEILAVDIFQDWQDKIAEKHCHI